MQKIKHLFEAYFVFTKRERRALFILFILVFFLICLSNQILKKTIVAEKNLPLYKSVNTESREENEGDNRSSFSANYYQKKNQRYNYERRIPHNKTSLFAFNPNTANEDVWLKLGVKESVVKTIMKYRQKGGFFRKAEDLRRIFGLSPALCENLIPFVSIPETNSAFPKPDSDFRKSGNLFTTININEAKLEDLKMLKGVGPGYAQRIINFREKLGGFYIVEQVAETYGLPDSVFQKIKTSLVLSNGPYRKINLNEIAPDELKKHPYIDYRSANNIISYRSQHGAFESVTDLRKIASLPPDLYDKIHHYLSVK